MNQLTQIPKTMSSRDLLEMINQVRQEMNEPIIRLNKFNEKIEDELDGDHYTKSVVQNSNSTESIVYDLTLDQCTLIGMRESKSVRKAILKKLKDLSGPRELTRFEILEIAMQAEKENMELRTMLQVQAPKVDFVDRYVESSGNKTFRAVAKILKIKEHELRTFLNDRKVMYKLGRTWVAHANHIDAKRFELKTSVNGAGYSFEQTLFTPKGVEWVASEIAKSKVRQLI